CELSHLQQQYDALLEVKNRAAIRYKLDYKKWRNFKRWLHDSQRREGGGEVCLPSDSDANRQEPRKASAKDKCQRFEEIGPDLMEGEGGDGVRAAEEIFLPSTIINKPPITQCSPENHVPAQPSARKRRRLSGERIDIGPLPHGLQRPLTKRSPPSSPSKTTRQCKHSVNDGISSVALHKQVISKHWHHWHRAKTPPVYWDIGFPDTQEASAINHPGRYNNQSRMA
ncbi:hypothetical protein BJ138DRAFT_1155670, partial [Hygrophoropsis aurantiaca]